MRALIVEDEMTSRVILQNILSQFGEVHVCLDGNEAIEAYSEAQKDGVPFDLICMDFMLPETDGYTALKSIRAIEHDRGIPKDHWVKVIMTTGLSNIESEYEEITSLCDAVLLKPIRKDTLLVSLKDLGLSQA